ncbi:PAS domain S-box-containing protein [Pseudochelatococcus lubricantis]|uniref:histidine kinase n=1 Tax=Pseudochelatococcus lubricantis TaxID=1538102 RepID=A0ABX0UX37_9HYPH|nr:ATP-binding protein [Pseudochelatococcus lubricantis]NIJ56435.1 PAS domain S-box-containing protein [Pseudochelatococcus lubricantis]
MSRRPDASKTGIWGDPALAALVEQEAAAVLWSLDGNRVIGASVGTAGLAPALRAAGGENLRGRLRRIAAALSAGSGVRLERITLPQGYGIARLLLECHRVATGEGEFLLTILRGPLPRLPRVVEDGFVHRGPDDGAAMQAVAAPSAPRGGDIAVEGNAGAARQSALDRLLVYAGNRSTVRFIWETDAQGRFARVSQELAGLVGRQSGGIEGRSWRDLVAEGIVHDPDGVAAALSHHDTWSGREVLWRVGDNVAIPLLPVELAGIPMHDAKRRFQGFRGFGLCRIARLRDAGGGAAAPAAPAAPAVSAPAAPAAPVAEPMIEPAEAPQRSRLTDSEKQAFRDIARALGISRIGDIMPHDDREPDGGAASEPASDIPAAGRPETAPHAKPGPRPVADIVTPAAALPAEARPAVPRALEEAGDAHREAAAGVIRPEDAEQDSVAVFRRIADRLPLGLLVTRGSSVLFASRGLLDLLGYTDAAAFAAAGGLQALFTNTPGGGDAPLALRTAQGTPLSADARMVSVPWEGGPATLMSFRRALEPRMEAHLRDLERELRYQESRVRALDTILDTATDGVVTLDGAGRLLSLNRSAEALFGREETDVVGTPLWRLLTTESVAGAKAYFEGLREGGLASVLNDGQLVTARARGGGTIELMMVMGRLAPDVADAPATRDGERFFAILRDVSGAPRREGALPEAAGGEAQGGHAAFLARVSHEIRTPLNAIIGFAEIMLEERFGPVGSERYREYLRDIHASGGQVISLVNDLLDLARIEAGRLELAPSLVSLNDVVSGCVGLLMPQAGRQQVVLRTSLARALPPVSIDERALQQIILNLLSNAVKFTDAGGQVIVSTARADDGGATLRIRDTGIGMTRAQVSAALEPFAQLTTTRLGHGTGTGLGLPLTRALVEASGGRFHISSALHEGTMVEIAFSAASPSAAGQESVRPSSQ